MYISGIDVDIERIAAEKGHTADEVLRSIEHIKSALVPDSRTFDVTEGGRRKTLTVTRIGVGPLITEFGRFWQYCFEVDDEWQSYEVLARADLDLRTLAPVFDTSKEIIVRPDSGCATGQRFTDLTCDCRDQLLVAMKKIAEAGQGLIVHMPTQDGRGKGLGFKLVTLWLQHELPVNTVESASLATIDGYIDVRTYAGVVAILQYLGVSANGDAANPPRLVLAVNNPKKVSVFLENGFEIVRRHPVTVAPTAYTRRHFEAKKHILGHHDLAA